MTQTMDLNKMGLAPMSEFEMEGIDGGHYWYLLASVILGGASILLSDGATTPYVIGMVRSAAAVAFAANALN